MAKVRNESTSSYNTSKSETFTSTMQYNYSSNFDRGLVTSANEPGRQQQVGLQADSILNRPATTSLNQSQPSVRPSTSMISSSVIATRPPVPRPSFLSRVRSSFRLNRRKRGYALILNHEKFDSKPRRTGTHHDVNKLKTVFQSYNIETHVKNDLTLSEIQRKVQKLKKFNFSKYECFIIFILTHGESRQLYAKDQKYDFIKEIEDPILNTNNTLTKKQKIFITQASYNKKNTIQTDASPFIGQGPVTKRNIYKFNATHFDTTIKDGTFFVDTFCRHLKLKEAGESIELCHMMGSVYNEVVRNVHDLPEDPKVEASMTKPFYFEELLK